MIHWIFYRTDSQSIGSAVGLEKQGAYGLSSKVL